MNPKSYASSQSNRLRDEMMVSMNLPIRHALATLSYRLGKVLRGTPAEFRDFRAAEGTRTPGEILAHIGT